MMRLLTIFLLLPYLAFAQATGPLQIQLNLGEIAKNGSGAQTAARQNLGLGASPGPYLPLVGGTLTGPLVGTSGSFTSLAVSGSLTGNAFTNLFAAPPPTGSVTPNTGAYTTLSASRALTASVGTITPAQVYAATAFGSCTWDSSHDVGACINLAITAAGGAGGGTVIVPAGLYGVSTTINQTYSGVHLVGAGTGQPVDTGFPANYQAITRLVWIGSADATMFTEYHGSLLTLYSGDVQGIVFDCASLAGVCVHITNVTHSNFDIGASEPRSVGIWFDTAGTSLNSPGPGNQYNYGSLWSRSTSNTYSPTGIFLDKGAGSSWNTSYNHFNFVYAWLAKGDGIVFGGTDNNVFDNVETSGSITNYTGRPVVWSGTPYTSPNTLTTNGFARANIVGHFGGPVDVVGYQSGSTITTGVHTGSAAINTVTLSTNSTTAANNFVLNFASTTNVLQGMSINCGGTSSGVMPNSTAGPVAATTIAMLGPALFTVASSTACTFGYGITSTAVSGTYTMTAVDGTHWNLTAPAGGNSQSNIAVASGAVSFFDMVIPLTGTPNTSDTFIITVPFPSNNNTLAALDKENAAPFPVVEPGANIFNSTTSNPWMTPWGGSGDIVVSPSNGTLYRTCFGGSADICGNSFAATVIGGAGNAAQNFGATSVGGGTNFATNVYSTVTGGLSNLADGIQSRAGGGFATTRTRRAVDCFGGGEFAAAGDSQTCVAMLHSSGATGSAFRLTADALTAGSTNCVNIPNNSAYAVTVTVVALDHTTVANNETWASWSGLLTRGANAASTALTMASTPTPITNGTVAGSAIAATADTTNGCLNVSFTPPTANTDSWRAVARVTTVETQ